MTWNRYLEESLKNYWFWGGPWKDIMAPEKNIYLGGIFKMTILMIVFHYILWYTDTNLGRSIENSGDSEGGLKANNYTRDKCMFILIIKKDYFGW
jgi:hypothetical protein